MTIITRGHLRDCVVGKPTSMMIFFHRRVGKNRSLLYTKYYIRKYFTQLLRKLQCYERVIHKVIQYYERVIHEVTPCHGQVT
jgi:hypothetical protein